MKTAQMKASRGYLFRACYRKVVSQHLEFRRDSKASRGVGKLYSKGEGLWCVLIAGC